MSEPRWGPTTVVKLLGGELRIRTGGLEEVRRRLDFTRKRMLNLEEPFNAFQGVWYAATEDVYASEGLPDAWPALSPAYAEWKERRFPGQPIGQLTGRLKASLTGGEGGVWDVGPRSLRYSSRVPYFRYQQLGTSRMPARPPLVMLPETLDKLLDSVKDYVTAEPT